MNYYIMDNATQQLVGIVYLGSGNAPALQENQTALTEAGSLGDIWDGSKWVTPTPDPAEVLAAWRETAKLPRAEFVIACVGAGIIDEVNGEVAAAGEWPDAFNSFLTGLDFADRVRARADWKDNATISRGSQTLAALQQAVGVTDDALDAIFGWAV